MESVALRSTFTSKLCEIAENNDNILVVASDSRGSCSLTDFFERFPDRSIEVGIAEQNLIGIAAGLSSTSKRVFACGPASFLSARCLEQVKIDIAYNESSVVIVGVSGGISYGALGFSHYSLHDIAVMRAFPKLDVIIPSDGVQMAYLTKLLCSNKKPTYVRIGRNPVPVIYDENSSFEIGKANVLREGKDILLIACGEMTSNALDACNMLSNEGIDITLLDMHTIKPLDTEAILKYAENSKICITIEEHSIYGGLGGAISEFLSQNHPMNMKILGLPDEDIVSGKSQEVFKYYGLDSKGIYDNLKKLITRG
ncbi:MAG: transketolase family protein [Oscillospiraceae bacterium]|nr:transketolase family protein [Oscillospiraceae bacterium]